ncbi:hypothetical protein N9L71_01650 [Verrucomicrobiales bacterium]|nr:hypothetical protein [Verrucomicrobiales bacterium]
MTLRDETLRLLRCPVTQQPLKRASASELEKLGINFPEGGFLTEDRSLAFRIENGMPILKPNEETRLGE